MTEASKEELAAFLAHPEIKLWHNGVAPELKPSTRNLYMIYLMRYFMKNEPATLLKRGKSIAAMPP